MKKSGLNVKINKYKADLTLQDYTWEGRFPSCLTQPSFKRKLPVKRYWVSAVMRTTRLGRTKLFSVPREKLRLEAISALSLQSANQDSL